MKRRDFLKILGIAPAVAALPVLAKSNIEKQLQDAKTLASYPEGTINKKEVVGIDGWKNVWGNKRITRDGVYEAGDIVIGADGHKYRMVKKL